MSAWLNLGAFSEQEGKPLVSKVVSSAKSEMMMIFIIYSWGHFCTIRK